MFNIKGENFNLMVGIDGRLYAVFKDSGAAWRAYEKGHFNNCYNASFGQHENAWCLENDE